jgi:hypothetical protein
VTVFLWIDVATAQVMPRTPFTGARVAHPRRAATPAPMARGVLHHPFMYRRILGSCALAAVACGGGGASPDASADGRFPDAAGPDAPAGDASGVDAPAAAYRGRIVVDEVTVQDHAELGRGGLVAIEFGPVPGVAPIYDDRDGDGLGCAAWAFDVSGGGPPLTDEGVVTISGASLPMPGCVFHADLGYHCPAGGGSGGAGDSIVDDAAGPGTTALVDAPPSGYTFSSADVGRHVWITGATTWNNGRFPIVAVSSGTNAVIYANPQALNQATFTGSYLVQAAAGPVPAGPEFLGDDDDVEVALAGGGGGHFASFTVGVAAGDDFTLDAPSELALTSVSFDGAPLTLACAGDDCGDGTITAIDLTTTDAVLGPGPDYAFPAAADHQAVVRCLGEGSAMTVPAGAMAAVAAAAPTRVRTTYRRATRATAPTDTAAARTTVLVGHAVVGYSDPPPPPADAGVDAAPVDAPPPDAFVCSPSLAPTSDGSSAARRALVLSEINPGDYIELYNNTVSAIALGSTDYWLCSPFNYCALNSLAPGVTVPAGGYATVPWPSAGSGCFASFPDTDLAGELLLYLNSTFSVDSNIMDFVCWGAGHVGSTRKPQAEATGKWTGACAPALGNGALHREIATDGIDASDYDATRDPDPMNCTP